MENNKLKKFSFLLSCLIILPYLIFRLINQAKIINYFPLDITNDISSHLAQLYFLKSCGFHNLCTYWYNGFYLLKFYPPGWFFFTYPLLLIFKKVETAAFVSILLMLVVSFIAIYKIINLNKKSWLNSLTFFLLLFGTATSISGFFRLGRVTELFGWMIFLILAYFILKYKEKEIKINFLWFSVFYAVLLVAQPIVAIPFHFFLFGLFLIKLNKKKELFFLGISILIGLFLSSFWWYPFITDIENESRTYEYLPEIRERFFDLSGQWTSSVILITFLPIITLIMFYIYYYSNDKNKKELLFYSPVLLLAFLVLTRIATFIPYLNFVYPEPYFTFFIIFILIFLFQTNIEKLPIFMQKSLHISLMLVVIISTLASFFITSYYIDHTELEKDTLEILNSVNERFIILESPSSTSYPKAYYSYGAIYLNLSTVSGWSPSEMTDEYKNNLNSLAKEFKEEKCGNFLDLAKKISLKQVVTYNEYCSLKEKCGLKKIKTMGNVCLLKI